MNCAKGVGKHFLAIVGLSALLIVESIGTLLLTSLLQTRSRPIRRPDRLIKKDYAIIT